MTVDDVDSSRLRVRLHLTNVAGIGAVQLLRSLLPALEAAPGTQITAIHLPDRGPLARYRSPHPGTQVRTYRRHLPNALSRLLECLIPHRRYAGPEPLLVLGDLPLRSAARQVVFVQTPHLGATAGQRRIPDRLKFGIARWVFRRNAASVGAYIVQTPVMRDALAAAHPAIAGRIHVIAQPVPQWLLDAGQRRTARAKPSAARLSLAYPAAGYPHKNHRLLAQIGPEQASTWPIEQLTLTLPATAHPAPALPWVACVGMLDAPAMLQLYACCDGLLFLSTDESYGLPLVEAMFIGLPIVCPDLPYARALCGDGAIYFDPQSATSLQAAVLTLQQRLRAGWWPDWTVPLRRFPADWPAVAQAMLDVVKTL